MSEIKTNKEGMKCRNESVKWRMGNKMDQRHIKSSNIRYVINFVNIRRRE